ncbi:type II secretion system protein GspM [Celerinatantimonas yamalensis]|uniref:Type II secretion system protein M n=1 Tax=Celerinatantimonas yamalensis TaxID=559956 RepID=A0ABW9G6Y5_9GAMM
MKQWWQSREPRERLILTIGGMLIVLTVFYQQGWLRYQNWREQTLQRIQTQQQTLQWVRAHSELLHVPANNQTSTTRRLTFSQVANQSAAQLHIAITRLQQSEQHFDVWIAPLPFNHLLQWLDILQRQYGYTPSNVELQAGDKPGMVNVNRLRFERQP